MRLKSNGIVGRHLAFGWVLLLAASACGNVGDIGQAASDPLLPGPFAVGVTSITFVDPARGRPLLTEIWYPASDDARALAPSPITDFVDPALAGLLEQSTVPLVAVRDVAISPAGPFPLVAFSHGNGGVRFQNIFQVERLASHGFIVVAPDHTGNTLFDIGTDQNSAANRPLDISFLYDVMTEETGDVGGPFAGWVDLAVPFGVTGHSFGAYTSFATASTDARVGAAMPLAAPGPISASYTAPTFLMLATEDKTIGEGLNEGIRQAYTLLPGPRYLAEIVDAGHYSFTIACLTGTGLGDEDGCGESERFGSGETFAFTPSEQVWALTNAYSVAMFGRYLKGVEEYDETLESNLLPEIVRHSADPRTGMTMLAAPRRWTH